MPPGARYRQLLESIYLDIVGGCLPIKERLRVKEFTANILEFDPWNESFYNAGLPLPFYSPEEILRGNRRGIAHPQPQRVWELFARGLHLDRLREEVDQTFRLHQERVARNDWVPALLSPDLVEFVGAWHDWFLEEHSARAGNRAGRANTEKSRRALCYEKFGRLLLALIPQPAWRGESDASVIYGSLAQGGHETEVDREFFIPPSKKAYSWRFGSVGDDLNNVRDLLELSYLFPVSSDTKCAVVEAGLKDFLSGSLVKNSAALENFRITALGGPMVIYGQLEGILYVAAPLVKQDGFLRTKDNNVLKELARNGAVRRHQLRERLFRELLSRELQQRDNTQGCLPLLVLKHLPKLISCVAAVAVRISRPSESYTSAEAGVTYRQAISRNVRRMKFTNCAHSDPLVKKVQRLAKSEGSFCLSGRDSRVRDLIECFRRFGGAEALIQDTRTACVLDIVIPMSSERWVFVLFFREPVRESESPVSYIDLTKNVTQLRIEIESAIDFAQLLPAQFERDALELALKNTGHAIRAPISLALNLAEIADKCVQDKDLEKCSKYLPAVHRSLHYLDMKAEAAERFFLRDAAPAPKSEPIDLGVIVHDCVELNRRAVQDVKIEYSGSSSPVMIKGDFGLTCIVIWEMVANATRAARLEGNDAAVSINFERDKKGSVSICVYSPHGRLTSSDCEEFLSKARARLLNRSNSSGGSGLGITACYQIMKAMLGDFIINILNDHFVAKAAFREAVIDAQSLSA